MCVLRVIAFSLLSDADADLEDRPTLQQLQILRGHGEEMKIISEVAYVIMDLIFLRTTLLANLLTIHIL